MADAYLQDPTLEDDLESMVHYFPTEPLRAEFFLTVKKLVSIVGQNPKLQQHWKEYLEEQVKKYGWSGNETETT